MQMARAEGANLLSDTPHDLAMVLRMVADGGGWSGAYR